MVQMAVGIFLKGYFDLCQLQALHPEQAMMAFGKDLYIYLVARDAELVERQMDSFFGGPAFGLY